MNSYDSSFKFVRLEEWALVPINKKLIRPIENFFNVIPITQNNLPNF